MGSFLWAFSFVSVLLRINKNGFDLLEVKKNTDSIDYNLKYQICFVLAGYFLPLFFTSPWLSRGYECEHTHPSSNIDHQFSLLQMWWANSRFMYVYVDLYEAESRYRPEQTRPYPNKVYTINTWVGWAQSRVRIDWKNVNKWADKHYGDEYSIKKNSNKKLKTPAFSR